MRIGAQPRRGLSIVEVLVALIVLSVGLLGMAGTSTLVLRASTDAARERQAIWRASARIAALAAGGCVRTRAGSDDSSGMHEDWAMQPPRGGFSLVDARVEWRSARGRIDSLVLRSAVQC